MPLQLTICRLCTRSRPEFQRAVTQLAQAYPGDIEVVELDCMAACDEVPAVMIEASYYPQMVPQELIRLVNECLHRDAA